MSRATSLTTDHIAQLLDGAELHSIQGDERLMALTRSCGMVIALTRAGALHLHGALEVQVTPAHHGWVLLNRDGLVPMPRYGGVGFSPVQANELVERGIAAAVLVEHALIDRADFYIIKPSVPFSSFSVHAGAQAVSAGAVFRLEDLPGGCNAESFQYRVNEWREATFGPQQILPTCDRFAEEALELLQAVGYPREAVLAALDFVYSRPAGEPMQEAGGVSLTFAGLCAKLGFDGGLAGEVELARVQNLRAEMRARLAAKPCFVRKTPILTAVR